MNIPDPDKPTRRPRYRGKNPRLFHEKYKEHQSERYPDEVTKVLAGGRTPAGMHRSVMMREILHVLKPRPGEIALDCTLGYGGHARELLSSVQPGGRLIGTDADPIELVKTEARLRALGFPLESLLVRRMNYAGSSRVVGEVAPEGVDLVLADLGLSSMQIDDPTRGFSFKVDGPLDMRMNPARGIPASEWLSSLAESELARLFAENADEPRAEEIARVVFRAHRHHPLETTKALAEVVRERAGDDAVRRVFQALRIAVNDEFGSLETLLRSLPACLKPGGRVAILSFHSGEDRRVKAAFKAGLQEGVYASIAPELIRASAEERRDNPRSTSAKLRYAIRR